MGLTRPSTRFKRRIASDEKQKDVDARVKPGHDVLGEQRAYFFAGPSSFSAVSSRLVSVAWATVMLPLTPSNYLK